MREESTRQRRLAGMVQSWLGRSVLVVGDAMLDEWRFAESERLCREAPAPVLTLRRRTTAAGGAANTAVNLSALGGRAALVAPVGADVAGDELHDCLDRAGVWDHTVSQPGRPTPVKRRLLAADQILLREDEGDSDDSLSTEAVQRLLSALDQASLELRAAGNGQAPALVICDYGLGALPGPVRNWLVEHRRDFATVALDAHDLARWHGLAPTVVTPSFAEAAQLLGPDSGSVPDRAGIARARLPELRARTGADVVAVTLDTDGAVVGGPEGEASRSHTTPVPASYAVGAGDVYLAAMTLALAAGATLDTAATLAQLAATTTVTQTGTCVCRRTELLAALPDTGPVDTPQVTRTPDPAASGGRPDQARPGGRGASYRARPGGYGPPSPGYGPSEAGTGGQAGHGRTARTDRPAGQADDTEVIVDGRTLAALVDQHRRYNRRIVFTNGCFDVLHRGHVHYLDQARRLGDVLIVAVNSDESVRRLKGADRPVNPVEDRVGVLAALSCVDHVVVFTENSPSALLEAVRPDVYVKGGDYPPEMVPEAPLVRRLGGEVHTLGYVPDRSTSAILARIRAHAADRDAEERSSTERDLADQAAGQPVISGGDDRFLTGRSA